MNLTEREKFLSDLFNHKHFLHIIGYRRNRYENIAGDFRNEFAEKNLAQNSAFFEG